MCRKPTCVERPCIIRNHHGRSEQHRPLAEGRCRCRRCVCCHIMAFQGIYGGGQKVAEEGLLGGQIAGQGGHMGGHTVAEWGLMGEEAEEDAGLKLAAGLAMAESLGSCSGACNRSPIA